MGEKYSYIYGCGLSYAKLTTRSLAGSLLVASLILLLVHLVATSSRYSKYSACMGVVMSSAAIFIDPGREFTGILVLFLLLMVYVKRRKLMRELWRMHQTMEESIHAEFLPCGPDPNSPLTNASLVIGLQPEGACQQESCPPSTIDGVAQLEATVLRAAAFVRDGLKDRYRGVQWGKSVVDKFRVTLRLAFHRLS